MSVLVALIGIVNTLSLSILERRRELGLLRIMGMTDKRVQRMVRLESALISALGTVTGLVGGLVVGWGLIFSINRLSDAKIGSASPSSSCWWSSCSASSSAWWRRGSRPDGPPGSRSSTPWPPPERARGAFPRIERGPARRAMGPLLMAGTRQVLA